MNYTFNPNNRFAIGFWLFQSVDKKGSQTMVNTNFFVFVVVVYSLELHGKAALGVAIEILFGHAL